MHPNTPPELSIVIPVRDEAEALPLLICEIDQIICRLKLSCELLIIDDHSCDDTCYKVKSSFVDAHCEIKLISLKHTNGKDWALLEGFKQARGLVIISLDGDGQNDPADIPCLLEALKNNDMVCGLRQKRHDPISKKMASLIANIVRVFITGDNTKDAGCALRAMQKYCAGYLYPYVSSLDGSAHYFFPTLLKIHGFKVVQIPVNHRQRFGGRSKFKLFMGRINNGLKGCFYIQQLRMKIK